MGLGLLFKILLGSRYGPGSGLNRITQNDEKKNQYAAGDLHMCKGSHHPYITLYRVP